MTNQELLLEIKRLRKENSRLRGLEVEDLEPTTYYFSQIKNIIQLEGLVNIKRIYKKTIFKKWFGFEFEISKEVEVFLQKLLDKNEDLIFNYYEEDLKANFIIPLINRVDFFMIDDEVRNFFEAPLTYKAENFIFSGEVDFMVSFGILYPKFPYFFIQEFKKGKNPTDPEPQLLAEMISAVELNKITTIRGAFITGENWNFVILEKLGKDKYQYFISKTFNSTNIEDLKGIYRNLQFVKNEIIEMVRKEKENTKNPE